MREVLISQTVHRCLPACCRRLLAFAPRQGAGLCSAERRSLLKLADCFAGLYIIPSWVDTHRRSGEVRFHSAILPMNAAGGHID